MVDSASVDRSTVYMYVYSLYSNEHIDLAFSSTQFNSAHPSFHSLSFSRCLIRPFLFEKQSCVGGWGSLEDMNFTAAGQSRAERAERTAI